METLPREQIKKIPAGCGEVFMLSGCLNPSCGVPYRYHREGRIFTVERVVAGGSDADPRRQVEHYWLCGSCSTKLKVIVEDGRVRLVLIEPEPFETSAEISTDVHRVPAL